LADFHARRAAHAVRGHGTGSTPRGSVSVAAASPISARRSSWVLDSEASFHVISDQSQLVASKPVADDACIQIADGTSCNITPQGSLYTFRSCICTYISHNHFIQLGVASIHLEPTITL